MPKIIITGRNFTEPDDGALQMLKNAGYEVIDLGKLGMAHGTPEKEVAEAVKDADAVIAGLEPYTEGVLSVCPKLKLISRRGIGYDSVDVEACHRHGVTLCRTAGMVEGSVAEQVMDDKLPQLLFLFRDDADTPLDIIVKNKMIQNDSVKIRSDRKSVV